MISEISFLWRHNLVVYYSRPWYLLAGGAQNPGFALYMYEWFVSINQWFKKYDSEIHAALE